MTKKCKLALVMVSVTILSACGGGGSPAPVVGGNNVVAPVVVSTASSIVATVPAPKYAAGSEELAAFNKLNTERTSCGFGALAQNLLLDKAAKSHADYLLVNYFIGHFETVGTPAFTGVTAEDRIAAAGYSTLNSFSATDEINEIIGSNLKTAMGVKFIRNLLNAPYHEAALMSGFRDVGLVLRNAPDAGSTYGPRVILQVNPAHKTLDGPQLFAANEIKTYPCDNSADIEPSLLNESPNPVPGRDLAKTPLGSSVYIAVRDGNTITIGSATMTNLTTGIPVALRTAVTAVNDPNKVNGVSYLKLNQAFISADAPLSPNTKHQVVVTGTNNGTPFNRNFTFTTGLAS